MTLPPAFRRPSAAALFAALTLSVFTSATNASAAPRPSLPENVGPVAVSTPTPTPVPPRTKQSCFIYQTRRGPGSDSRWQFVRDYPYYNSWYVFIPAPTAAQLTAMFRWACPPTFRTECGWVMTWGVGPNPVVAGNYDPCNRCELDCSTCSSGRYDMPATLEYPAGSGIVYNLMNKPFSAGGRCGTPECPCYLSGIVSPLVLDFKGKGLVYTADGEHVAFDLAGDGAVPTAWLKNGEDVAFLSFDRNTDGAIADIQELFGNETKGPDDKVSEDGFGALVKYDLNKDKRIDAADVIFSKLSLWFDRDADGKTGPGELKPIASAGVKAISLETRDVTLNKDPYGNLTRMSSDAVLESGEIIAVHDVWFAPAHPHSLRTNPGGRAAAQAVPGKGEANYELLRGSWQQTAEQEGFGEGEMPFEAGEIHTRLNDKGEVTERYVEWKHPADTCRLVAEFSPDWTFRKSRSACK